MLFKSALVTQVSGSVGGIVGSHNSGGMYFRARAAVTNPNTSAQVAARQRLATLSAAWNALTQAQQDAWNAYAETISTVGPLGDPINISGQNAYIGANTLLEQAGGTTVDEAPAQTGEPSFNIVFENNVGDEFDVNIQAAGNDWASEDGAFMLVYASRGVSPGTNYFTGPFRFAGAIAGSSSSAPTGAQTITAPFVVATGDKRFIRVRVVDAAGRYSLPTIPAALAV